MREFFYIFLGSGLGGVTRFGLGKFINTFNNTHFPFSTLIVNVLACFILGIMVGLADDKQLISAQMRLFWVVGFCGGFSTFSTFSNEALTLINSGFHLTNIIYIVLSVALCILAIYFGIWLIADK